MLDNIQHDDVVIALKLDVRQAVVQIRLDKAIDLDIFG